MGVIDNDERIHVLLYVRYVYALAWMTIAYAVLGFLEGFERWFETDRKKWLYPLVNR